MKTTLRIVSLLIACWPAAASAYSVSLDPGSAGQKSPDLAARAVAGTETYMAAFEVKRTATDHNIYVRALDARGDAVGGSVQVSSVPPGYRATKPSIASRSSELGKTTYMVAWQLEDEMGAEASSIQAAVLDVDSDGNIDIASKEAIQVSFCGPYPAWDPDVAATTDTPLCGHMECVPYIVAYRCARPSEEGRWSSYVKVATINPATFASSDTAFYFTQGFEDSPEMAPHVAFGDFELSDRYVLTYRAVEVDGRTFVKAAEFNHFAESASVSERYSEEEAAGAPVVAFSKGAALADEGAWTIVRKVATGGEEELVGRHFNPDFGMRMGKYRALGPKEDRVGSYRVAGSPNTSDFLLVYSHGGEVSAAQVKGDDKADIERWFHLDPWVDGPASHRLNPAVAFAADSVVGDFLFGWWIRSYEPGNPTSFRSPSIWGDLNALYPP